MKTDSLPDNHKINRKRGGQPGNRNARKHGFYSTSLAPSQFCEFWNSINRNHIAPEIAVLSVKIRSLLRIAPGNCRALREAGKLLLKWYSTLYRLDKTDTRSLKKVIRALVESGGGHLPGDSVDEE